MEKANISEWLIERLRQQLDSQSEILEAYLFGSQARRQAQAHSDIDVAVYLDEEHAPNTGFGYRAKLLLEGLREAIAHNRAA